MSQAPLSTTVRIFFALALAAAAGALLLSVVGNAYPEPANEFEFGFPDTDIASGDLDYLRTASFGIQSDDDYARNAGGILSLIGTAMMAGAVAGFRASLNPARAGFLIAGIVVFLTGIERGTSGANDWLVILWAAIALAVLVYVGRWLEDGHPERALADWPGAATNLDPEGPTESPGGPSGYQ